MRLWSLHPRHLDARGLVARWREGLLARAVLRGATRGYRRHPQRERFSARWDPVAVVDCDASRVVGESRQRGYAFDASKITYSKWLHGSVPFTAGQIEHEWAHLLGKRKARDPFRWRAPRRRQPTHDGCLHVVPGPIADWERP